MHLNPSERQRLIQIARTTKDVRVLRRAQALLDLSSGDHPQVVSSRYRVALSTIYNWMRRGQDRGLASEALGDLPRPGRPRLARSYSGNRGRDPERSTALGGSQVSEQN